MARPPTYPEPAIHRRTDVIAAPNALQRARTRLWFCRAVLLTQVVLSSGCGRALLTAEVWTFEPAQCLDLAAVVRQRDVRSAAQASLAGAGNETLSFGFAVRASGEGIVSPIVDATPLVGRAGGQIPATAVRVYRLHPARVPRWPGWHLRCIAPQERVEAPLDVLIPLDAPIGGLPRLLARGETYAFWTDVSIPKGTAQGIYEGQIRLHSGGQTVGDIRVEVTVWPLVLPDHGNVTATIELDHDLLAAPRPRPPATWSSSEAEDATGSAYMGEQADVLRHTLLVLQQHRLVPVLPNLAPRIRLAASNDLLLDWTDYDALAGPCLEAGQRSSQPPRPFWPLPVAPAGDSSRRQAIDLAESRLLKSYVQQCAAHFEGQGWIAWAFARPPVTDLQDASLNRWIDLLAGVSPSVPVLYDGFPQDMRPYGWTDGPPPTFAGAVNIWAPSGQFYEREAMTKERTEGNHTWLRVDRPPFTGTLAISAPPTFARVLAWQANALGAENLLVGLANAWPTGTVGSSPDDCLQQDDAVLLYPGDPFGLEVPVESVRLKWLRQGLQDAAYVRLLDGVGLAHITQTLTSALSLYAGADAYRAHFADGRPPGWPREPALFEAARHIMADAYIEATYHRQSPEKIQAFARSATWRRFMLDSRRVTLEVDGARVRPLGGEDAGSMAIEITCTITNGTRVPFTGELTAASAGPDWLSPGEPMRVGPIGPSQARRAKWTLHATSVPIPSDGKIGLAVELRGVEGTVAALEIPVALAAAVQTDRPPRIDGDLRDWPAGTVNVLGQFRLICGGRATAASLEPRRRTTAFVLRHENDLYVAVNCEGGVAADGQQGRRNRVSYEDMIPVDEELVEILFDPFNVGTRSPADLFHVVIKQAGFDLTEKGVTTVPPCGASEPWAADVEVATRTTDGRWVAEVRIPLRSFGNQPTSDGAVWGLNVTRFDFQAQEYSTWSGATGTAYDPLSLGNLLFP